MGKSPPQSPTQQEMVAAALNEQGFLFSQLIRENVRFGVSGKGHANRAWKCIASEYPVTASDGSQTRVDLVLQHVGSTGFYLCVECKRANPQFKQWVFFDNEDKANPPAHVYFECLRVTRRPMLVRGDATHGIERLQKPARCKIFNLYLEVAVNREKRAGYTETIEDAFRQVIRGQSGFMMKQLKFDGESKIRPIPVVVTTAQLFEADFDLEKVSLGSGTIAAKELKLEPLSFCAVNYHPDDSLAVRSDYAPEATNIEKDIFKKTRTVFVVQSEAMIEFLNWLVGEVVC